MVPFKQIICPVSTERIDENRVRVTALGVVLTMGAFFITGLTVFPAALAVDFFIRGLTKLKYSPLSWLSYVFVNAIGVRPVLINKAPKVFAARIGLLLTSITTIASLLGMSYLAFVVGATLVGFAFLECGLNFCAGCWIYTYVVYPLVRKDQ
ncbi:MAG: DUF4395 domain-containing protein [Bacteroidales bacterium]|nr:DUF4395 domain-containing protein [Bacteroidales bacterium]